MTINSKATYLPSRTIKSTKPRCLFCGLTREEDHSCLTDWAHAKCINCEGDHFATSHTCLSLLSTRLFSAWPRRKIFLLWKLEK
ncbi:hypothetical protein ALC56_13076 [Trachymyrmex septentrionalis]|uniref:Uncharacterized protein n=1 Tax=Trachymyrmex septentrionalis TaxID=34720 RepID=A0A195EWE3_9HYME|nr:hypothetical protein ALC56_13076 [Trachymyrmex septentrionalis]